MRSRLMIGVLFGVMLVAGSQLLSHGSGERSKPYDETIGEGVTESKADDAYLAPVAIAPVGEDRLAVLGSVGRRLLLLDRASGQRRGLIRLPVPASGLVVDGQTAYVTTAEPAGRVLRIDLDQGRITRAYRAGHMPMAPTLSPDRDVLYVANRFENRVLALELRNGTVRTARVIREPVAMAIDRDGGRLFVANHLPEVRPFLDDENPWIAAEVSVVDTHTMEQIATVELPNGSQGLRGLALSPCGRYVVVTHIQSHYTVPTWRLAGGAMNRNAISIIRTDALDLLGTAILDDPRRGAANPWGVAFTRDGTRLVVAHAGTHELGVIDVAPLLQRIRAERGADSLVDAASLQMMAGLRRRIAVPVVGPRAVVVADGLAFTAGYFSDDVAVVSLATGEATEIASDDAGGEPSLARRGERYFNDATLCMEHWQSCASCHPDGRADALYWDLLNDGIGNTKNTKSLLMAALTPPAMSRGVREDAHMAAEAGIRHIQFGEPSVEQVAAIEQYFIEMKAVPSPYLRSDAMESPKTDGAHCGKCHYPGVLRGKLSAAAERGKAIFEGKAGCVRCHPHPYFTSMETVDAGLGTGFEYDVPSLVEAWRSAPYLHHGDGMTIEETITDFNHLGVRGNTAGLTPAELQDLIEYVRSL